MASPAIFTISELSNPISKLPISFKASLLQFPRCLPKVRKPARANSRSWSLSKSTSNWKKNGYFKRFKTIFWTVSIILRVIIVISTYSYLHNTYRLWHFYRIIRFSSNLWLLFEGHRIFEHLQTTVLLWRLSFNLTIDRCMKARYRACTFYQDALRSVIVWKSELTSFEGQT